MNAVKQFRSGAYLPALFALILTAPSHAAPTASADDAVQQQIDASVRGIVEELQRACPLADAGDRSAAARCRHALFGDSRFREILSPFVLWGRQRDPAMALKETPLTQFAPDVLAGMYVPLFMFDGKYTLSFNEREKLYLATLGAAFRNRLQPGQYPYPFWHEPAKWNGYENANSLLLWIDPGTRKAKLAQFSVHGRPLPGYPAAKATPPAFDGKWLWTDEQGKTQPAVTLFDGLFRDDNPHKPALEKSYRAFAIELRESQCFSCHVPDNPDKMKKLVLLQSPAHAAAEIKRVLRDVREKRMPLDELGIEKPLEPRLLKTLLESGGEFEKVVDAAREWERRAAAK